MPLGESLAELDQISALMEVANPTQQASLAELLERRAGVIGRLPTYLDGLHQVERESIHESLRRAQDAGERLLERLRVARAGCRDEMGRLYHSDCLLRALAAETRRPPSVDFRG
jgi:hypothetical protein